MNDLRTSLALERMSGGDGGGVREVKVRWLRPLKTVQELIHLKLELDERIAVATERLADAAEKRLMMEMTNSAKGPWFANNNP